jgi:hypothetical protein
MRSSGPRARQKRQDNKKDTKSDSTENTIREFVPANKNCFVRGLPSQHGNGSSHIRKRKVKDELSTAIGLQHLFPIAQSSFRTAAWSKDNPSVEAVLGPFGSFRVSNTAFHQRESRDLRMVDSYQACLYQHKRGVRPQAPQPALYLFNVSKQT